MAMIKSRTFKSGNSEAVRLPKEVALGIGREVLIERDGDTLKITPVRRTPKELVEALRALPKPTTIEERDEVEIPERPGL